MTKIGVLVSGGGSNFEALVKAAREGGIPGGEIAVVISNKVGVGALDRAKRLGVEAVVLESKGVSDRAAYFARVAEELKRRGVGLVCLAGFLLKLEPALLRPFAGRVLNIHPALLPKYGGAGMYGHFVHEAVLKAGEKISGCSVHVVDEEFDHGPVLLQERVPVLPGDTPDTLAARVLEKEHEVYPKAVAQAIRQLSEATRR